MPWIPDPSKCDLPSVTLQHPLYSLDLRAPIPFCPFHPDLQPLNRADAGQILARPLSYSSCALSARPSTRAHRVVVAAVPLKLSTGQSDPAQHSDFQLERDDPHHYPSRSSMADVVCADEVVYGPVPYRKKRETAPARGNSRRGMISSREMTCPLSSVRLLRPPPYSTVRRLGSSRAWPEMMGRKRSGPVKYCSSSGVGTAGVVPTVAYSPLVNRRDTVQYSSLNPPSASRRSLK